MTSITAISLGAAGLALAAGLRADLRRRAITPAALVRQRPLAILLAILDLAAAALMAAEAAALFCAMLVAGRGVLRLSSAPGLVGLGCVTVLTILWSEGKRQIQYQRPPGTIFAEWLTLSGAGLLAASLLARRTPAAMPHAQAVGLAGGLALLAGGALLAVIVPRFARKYEGLRILDRVGGPAEAEPQFHQPEYTPPSPECPNPGLWRMLDSQTTEVEVLDLLKSLVVALKPNLVVETGTFLGHGALKLAEGVKENGFGRVITVEFDPQIHAHAKRRFAASGLEPWIEARNESSLESTIEGTIDFLYSDSHLANREQEIRRLLPQLDPRGLLVIHDASSHFRLVREAALRMEQEGLISVVLLSTPRGVAIAQRRAGRR